MSKLIQLFKKYSFPLLGSLLLVIGLPAQAQQPEKTDKEKKKNYTSKNRKSAKDKKKIKKTTLEKKWPENASGSE